MNNMSVTIHISKAAEFIAQLVREGVLFEADQPGNTDWVVINFTGGY